MVNNEVRKVTKDLAEPMRDYKLGVDIFEDISELNDVSWVDCMPLKQVKILIHPTIVKTRLADGIFSGYMDAKNEPVAGYFVF